MNVVAIVQARMGSTRLPGKVLMPLAGRPVLAHVVDRLALCRSVQHRVVATSTDPADDAIAVWCRQQGVACFRGSLQDVLDRYHQAALAHGADAIVRITADCPAIDPAIVDEVVAGFIAGGFDFYSLTGEFPDGLDCSVFSAGAIARAWREARLPSEREHVGPYIEHHPEWFRCGGLRKFNGLAHHRWTLDEPHDLALLQALFSQLDRGPGTAFGAAQVLALLARQPQLVGLNQHVVRNEGYLKSLAADPSVRSTHPTARARHAQP